MSKEEGAPFLGDSREYHVAKHAQTPSQRCRSRLLGVSILTNALLTLVCAVLGFNVFNLTSKPSNYTTPTAGPISDPYSPANPIIEYEYRPVIGNDTRFTGHPGPEWEKNMHSLMEGTLLRVSEEEMELYGDESIPFKDGGFAGGLGVAHNLHCIKKLKKFLYRDYFYPEIDTDGDEFLTIQNHADHCLDFLRQSIMCRLDFSLYTVYWDDHNHDIPTHKMPGVQKCVNWDKLHAWMLARSVSTDMLVRPDNR